MKKRMPSLNVGRGPTLSQNGVLRAEYQAEMKTLVAQKKAAWAQGNIDASEKISGRMQELIEKERGLGSGIGIVIRT